MSDLADHAQQHEEQERAAAVQRHAQRAAQPLGRLKGRVCLDCGERIPAQRLQARPEASRCIEDERRYEARLKHYRQD